MAFANSPEYVPRSMSISSTNSNASYFDRVCLFLVHRYVLFDSHALVCSLWHTRLGMFNALNGYVLSWSLDRSYDWEQSSELVVEDRSILVSVLRVWPQYILRSPLLDSPPVASWTISVQKLHWVLVVLGKIVISHTKAQNSNELGMLFTQQRICVITTHTTKSLWYFPAYY